MNMAGGEQSSSTHQPFSPCFHDSSRNVEISENFRVQDTKMILLGPPYFQAPANTTRHPSWEQIRLYTFRDLQLPLGELPSVLSDELKSFNS